MEIQAGNFKKDWQKRQRSLGKRGADRAYLYAHLEADTGNIFYIGMGKTPNRPWDFSDRSDEHIEHANKHGVKVEIITDSIHNWHIAGWWERWWISACREAGIDLVNLASGGEGAGVMRDCTKDKLRAANTGKKYSPETNAKKGRSGPKQFTPEGYAAICAPHSEESKEKMRISALNLSEEKKSNQKAGVQKFLAEVSEEWLTDRARKARAGRTPESIALTIKKGNDTKRKNKEIHGEDYYKKPYKPRSDSAKGAIKAGIRASSRHWSQRLTAQVIFDVGTLAATTNSLCKKFNLAKATVRDIQIHVAEILGVPPKHVYERPAKKCRSPRKGLGTGSHMKLEEYKDRIRGDKNVSKRFDVVEKIKAGNSKHSTKMWADPAFREKMLFRDWYNSCVRDKHYWGA